MRFGRALRRLRSAGTAALLAGAFALSAGTSKKPAPRRPAPSTASAAVNRGPTTAPPPGPGATPPPAKTTPAPVAGGARRAPRIARLRHELPDGVFHGYLFTAPGARRCGRTLPAGQYVRCAIDRGRLRGCGTSLFRHRSTAFCQNGVYRSCRVGSAGRLRTCGGPFSGWTITWRRGSYRRCCIHQGRVKYCTNDPTYVCTKSDRTRTAPRTHRYRRRLAPLPRTTVRTRRPVRRGSWQKCRIFNGRVSSCFGWYHGYAVVLHNGAYRRCRIFNGQVSTCGSWFKGKAVAFRNGAFRRCTIFNGRISHCGTWFRGQAAVYRNR